MFVEVLIYNRYRILNGYRVGCGDRVFYLLILWLNIRRRGGWGWGGEWVGCGFSVGGLGLVWGGFYLIMLGDCNVGSFVVISIIGIVLDYVVVFNCYYSYVVDL